MVEIQRDIRKIEKRKQSQNIKMEGDMKYAENDLDAAFEKYEQALELDNQNEYAFSNIGLIYLKRQNYEKCIEYTTKALELIEGF